jgi:acyl-CoA thioesterase II
MRQGPLDLSNIFTLEHHGPDTFVGESPLYPWGRIFGGLVVAQALWAATSTVREEHVLHSMHAYFVLGGDPNEPVRYEVDRLRNGRSFTTRSVVARQSSGAILSLSCSFQRLEDGPETQSADFPSNIPDPEGLECEWMAGIDRRDIDAPESPPRSVGWCRLPVELPDDRRMHDCALAYLSDIGPMGAIARAHPDQPLTQDGWQENFMTASLDHAMWFHHQARADDWLLIDMTGHGIIKTRGLATGPMFDANGVHVATIAQEGLLRETKPR